jgi:acetylornithine aminotransferase
MIEKQIDKSENLENILHCIGHNILYGDIVRADNCILYDSKGNDYLDMESGVWCTSIGHCNPNIVNALSKQASEIMHTGYCYLNPIMETASENILDITGLKSGKTLFLSSGSEAVDLAIRISRHVTGKKIMLTMKDSFLSSFGYFDNKADWVFLDWLNKESIAACPFAEVAAFVFEPGSSSGFVRFPPRDLIAKIVSEIHKNGGLIICNEVTTGIGRTGRWFGYNHYDILPDIVAIGKGLGNGYPVSCIACSEKTSRSIDYKTFRYFQSHQNDPLGAAVANEVLNVIKKQGLLVEAETKGEKIISELNRIKNKYGIINEIRGKGLMIAVDFISKDGISVSQLVNEQLLEQRVILTRRPNSETFRIDPSLTISDDNISRFIECFEYAVSVVSMNFFENKTTW